MEPQLFSFLKRPEDRRALPTGGAAVIATSKESAWEVLWRARSTQVSTHAQPGAMDARANELGADGMQKECEDAGWGMTTHAEARIGSFVLHAISYSANSGFATPVVGQGNT